MNRVATTEDRVGCFRKPSAKLELALLLLLDDDRRKRVGRLLWVRKFCGCAENACAKKSRVPDRCAKRLLLLLLNQHETKTECVMMMTSASILTITGGWEFDSKWVNNYTWRTVDLDKLYRMTVNNNALVE